MLRATMKSLLARKLRLLLSGLAVVLSVMFVAGSFVLTDTLGRSFDALFADVYTYTDIQVTAKPRPGLPDAPMPAALVDEVSRAPGVTRAQGLVTANGVRIRAKNGKFVANQAGTSLGANWVGEDELIKLSSGGAPERDDQVVINAALAKAGRFAVGDSIELKTPAQELQAFTIAGVFNYAGGRDSIGGEFLTFFTTPVAQTAMLGERDVFSVVDVKVASGESLTKVRDGIQAQVGGDYEALTGKQLTAKASQPLKDIFKYVRYVLLGFGAVALLVGVFLILNTFSIIVAQRTQELALLRAMGASRGQIIGSVLIEAILIGVIGSAVGFAAGIGLGAGGAYLLGSLGGGLKIASIGIPLLSVLLSFGVGIAVTIVAAIVPALRASKVAPVAALREAASTDRPLTKITTIGAALSAAAGGLLAWGLSGAGDSTLLLILAGVLGLLVGVALLTPIISRPVVSLLGRLFAWSVPGQLGRRNSARNPRRTAITAAAIMIGITLVTAISTVFASLSSSISTVVDQELKADLIIAGQQTSEIPPTIEATALRRVRELPDLAAVAAVTYDQGLVNGKRAIVLSYDDLGAARKVLQFQHKDGDITSLRSGQLIVDERTAKDAKVRVGDQVRIQLAKGGEQSSTVVGITAQTNVNNGFIMPIDDARARFRSAQAIQAYAQVRAGASVDATKREIDTILTDSPEVTVATRAEFVSNNSASTFDFILNAVQVLLLVAMAISVLGVINTLVLSVIERTRELGMLRAIGLRRSQTMRMITVESMVISLFGTLLGLALGAGLGAAIVVALKNALGFGEVTLPWTQMAVYLVASLFVGVLAAVLPAIRAARLNVLGAIAYE